MMKNAAKTLDIINIIWIGVFTVIPAIVSLCLNQLLVDYTMKWINTYASEAVAEISWDLSIVIRTAIIVDNISTLVMGGVAFILALFGFLRIINGDIGKTPHIFEIVSGGLAAAPLGIVGGILGLVSIHKRDDSNVEVEKPQEEIVVDVTEE